VAEESLMAIRTVVAFGGEASAMRRFERELTRAKMGGIRASGHGWGGGGDGVPWFIKVYYLISLNILRFWGTFGI